ncbi:hypothetical protein [Ancylobacter rudongensis]|uniref:Uncharacterized protein n=1 Tax=Ancylobacter rudongensis TaxID=177413 RepID=A0A1G4UPY7_9HYPH|nr:hypothetical protein [Ancylobacter rudongensis]SCW95700.1 hypothetical protein SAMN05660859_0095 [Ancylobacter rudongensis]
MDYTQYLPGKAIQTGCEWRLKIKITSAALEAFPETATFLAQIRDDVEGPIKAALSTALGSIVRADANTIELRLSGAATTEWRAGTVVMDVVRTDLVQPVHLGFDLEIPVKRSITRL